MTEERVLVAKIRPVLDEEGSKEFVKSIQSMINNGTISVSNLMFGSDSADSTASNNATQSSNAQTEQVANAVSKGMVDANAKINQAAAASSSDSGNGIEDGWNPIQKMWRSKGVMGKANAAMSVLSRDTSSMEDGDAKDQATLLKSTAMVMQTGITTGLNLFKQTLGVIQDLYSRLKQASPLLQAIESMFNLAMTLFFMPLGNKLAEVLLPATLELVEAVVDMWDGLEGKTLTEMFEYAFTFGVNLIAKYFQNIGSLLADQGGLLGSIGKMLLTVSSFMQDHLYDLLKLMFDAVGFVLGHIKELITILAGFFATKIALDIATMYVIATSNSIGGWAGAGIAAAGIATAGIVYGGMSVMGYADGGYIPSTNGGQLAIVGEGGEGEYIIPESKIGAAGGVYNIYINGYTDSELKKIIEDVVSEQISQSKIRGSF